MTSLNSDTRWSRGPKARRTIRQRLVNSQVSSVRNNGGGPRVGQAGIGEAVPVRPERGETSLVMPGLGAESHGGGKREWGQSRGRRPSASRWMKAGWSAEQGGWPLEAELRGARRRQDGWGGSTEIVCLSPLPFSSCFFASLHRNSKEMLLHR